jgi:hypothetical protein
VRMFAMTSKAEMASPLFSHACEPLFFTGVIHS